MVALLGVRVPVVVGVVINSQDQVLVAQRQLHQHQGGSWEFPGGKIQPGESQAHALRRELLEEVGILVVDHFPWLDIIHDYSDKSVHLHVHQVKAFQGNAWGCEGQPIAWLHPQALIELPLPKANEAIVQALLQRCSKQQLTSYL